MFFTESEKFFQSSDIDRAVQQVTPALCLTGMLTDKRTCRGKRIVMPDQIDGICITMLPDQRYVSGNIHICRAMRDTGNLLPDLRLTSVLFNVTHILVTEKFNTLQHNICRFVTDSAIRRILDHPGKLDHIFKGLHICLSFQDLAHHVLNLLQTVSAGNALTAGLTPRTLQKRKLHRNRTHSGRICFYALHKFVEKFRRFLVHFIRL